MFGEILLQPRNRQATRWFDNGAGVLEDVANGGTNLIGVDGDELVNMLLTQS